MEKYVLYESELRNGKLRRYEMRGRNYSLEDAKLYLKRQSQGKFHPDDKIEYKGELCLEINYYSGDGVRYSFLKRSNSTKRV